MADLKIAKIKLTLNGKEVEMSLDAIRKKAREVAQQMQDMDPSSKAFKALRKDLDNLHKAENDLVPILERVNHYMNELAQTSTTDIGRSLRELTKFRDALPGDSDSLGKVNEFIRRLKDMADQNRNLGMTFDKAKQQLNDLVNTSPEKLRQGLAAINKELDKTTNPSDRAELKGYARQYEAQIAVTQYGRAGNASLGSMNADQLRAEQSRLRSAYLATDGAQGYETISKEYLDRLLNVNKALQDISETERKRAQAAREAAAAQEQKNKVDEIYDRWNQKKKITLQELIELEKYERAELQKAQGLNLSDDEKKNLEEKRNNLRLTVEAIKELTEAEKKHSADNVMSRLWNGQKVSLQELIQTQKTYEEQLSQMKGVNLSAQDQQQVDMLERNLERVKQAMTDITQIDVQKTLNNLDTQNLQQLEAALKQVKETITTIPAWNEGDLRQAADDADRLQDAIDELKAKMEGIDNLDFDHLENVPTEKLEQALKDLEAQEKKLAGTDKQAAQQMAENKRKVQAQITRNKQAVQDYANAEKIAGETGKHNVTELRQAYETLQQKLLSLNTDQKKEIRETQLQMRSVKNAIDEVTGAAQKQSSVWQSAVRNITAYVGVFGAFNFVKSKMQEIISLNMKYSDQLADIRKVAQVSMDEVNQLSRAIAKIDTRTSIEELAQISYAGAKLGMSQYGVGGMEAFTRAANQLNVALKEDLGDEALTAVAKLTENMGLIRNMGVEKAMTATSSAIFKLAATSTAAGGPIVEFSKRLAAVAGQAGITTDQLLGMASASDSMMLMPEVASTAFNKMITAMQTNHNLIENQLNITKGTINELFSQGRMMDAIVLVFEKMKEMGNMNALKPIFKDLGSDGARLNMVMTAMAKNVDMLKDHLYVAQEAFEQGTAVTEEYNIQQETAQALMERAANLWEKSFVNPEGVDLAREFAQAWYDITESLTQGKAAVLGITVVLKGLFFILKAIVDLIPALLSAGGLWGIITVITKLGESAKVAGGFMTMLTTSIRGLSMATKAATVLGVFVAAIELMTYALGKAKKEADEFKTSQEDINKALSSGHADADKATMHLNAYKTALEDAKTTEDDRTRILKKFNYEYRGYLNKLGIEIKTVGDLKNAYAALNEELRKERYYQMQNQLIQEKTSPIIQQGADATTRYNAIMNKRYGKAGAFDATYIREHQDEGLEALYKRILSAQYGGGGTFNEKGHYITKATFGDKTYDIDNAGDRELAEAIGDMISAFRRERDTTKQIVESFKPYVGDYNPIVQQALGELENEAPDKAAAAAAKKAQQDEKQRLRKELQDAKQESDAIIAKVEEWYRLQETVVTGFAADGKWTQEQAELVNRQLEEAKNEALANARLAISGRDTETWERTKEQMRVMMFDTGKWSQELFQQMMDVSMKNIRQNLANIDKGGGKYGITTSSLKDALDKNAAGNKRKVQELRNKTAQEVEKMLLQYNYFEQAVKAFDDRLTQLGVLTETAEQAAARIREAEGSLRPQEKTEQQLTRERTDARRSAGMQFVQGGAASLSVDYENTQALERWLREFTGAQGTIGSQGFEFQFKGWADAFRQDFAKWLLDSETYKSDIQAFYLSLVDFDRQYYEDVKKYRDKQQKDFETRWEVSGKGRTYDAQISGMEMLGRSNKLTGIDQGTNFSQMAGFTAIGQDPEIAASQLRMQQMQEELDMFIKMNEGKKLEGAALDAYNQMLAEKQKARDDAAMATAETVMSKINERIQKLEQWTQPIEQFGSDVGDAMAKAVFESESMAEGMKNALKSMVQAWGQSTIDIVKQLLIQQLKQKMIGRAMGKQAKQSAEEQTEATEEGGQQQLDATNLFYTGMSAIVQQAGQQIVSTKKSQAAENAATTATETQGEVMAGIAGGAAKTIGQLGWWGIPLVAVITALLQGLLSMALGALFGGSKSNENQSAKTNVKLASGMLTYDEGNVQEVLGSDGRVYRAREQHSLPEGVSMVTQPIATTVNGQPALVGERGPEIVIGRRTTRRLMMNEPGLLARLAQIEQGGGFYAPRLRGLRTLDDGNLADLVGSVAVPQQQGSSSPDGSQTLDADTAAALQQLPAAMAAFAQVMQTIQTQGIPGYFKKFGSGSLDEGMRDVSNFRKRYPNG